MNEHQPGNANLGHRAESNFQNVKISMKCGNSRAISIPRECLTWSIGEATQAPVPNNCNIRRRNEYICPHHQRKPVGPQEEIIQGLGISDFERSWEQELKNEDLDLSIFDFNGTPSEILESFLNLSSSSMTDANDSADGEALGTQTQSENESANIEVQEHEEMDVTAETNTPPRLSVPVRRFAYTKRYYSPRQSGTTRRRCKEKDNLNKPRVLELLEGSGPVKCNEEDLDRVDNCEMETHVLQAQRDATSKTSIDESPLKKHSGSEDSQKNKRVSLESAFKKKRHVKARPRKDVTSIQKMVLKNWAEAPKDVLSLGKADDSNAYYVEEVNDVRFRNHRTDYFVKWEKWIEEYNSWMLPNDNDEITEGGPVDVFWKRCGEQAKGRIMQVQDEQFEELLTEKVQHSFYWMSD